LLFAAPMADAVWALLLDVAIDAVAIRLGLWTWTIRLDEGWFGVPWGNFFAWLFVAFWFSFFTRLVRAYDSSRWAQWVVPLAAFCGLIAALVPFVALENQAALPFIPDHGQSYNNDVWMIFGLTFALFLGVTWWALLQRGAPRAGADHWLLLMRLGIHGLFLLALLVTGYYLDAPLLLVAAVSMMLVELVFVWYWRGELLGALRGLFKISNKRTTVQSPRVFE
jgi:hypothetical protein